MKLDVVLLPDMLKAEHLKDRTVAVFDVLRATTTMTAALAAGVREIRVFGDLESAMVAGRQCAVRHLLVGERQAVKPSGFDLGNSPGVFNSDQHRGQTLLMATTNGTRAIVAAGEAPSVFLAALVNARAAARALIASGRDITLLCSGTEGEVSLEDVLGAGAVIEALRSSADVELVSDSAKVADGLFQDKRGDLLGALSNSRGGANVKRAGLSADLEFCARLDSIDAVGVVRGNPAVVTLWERA